MYIYDRCNTLNRNKYFILKKIISVAGTTFVIPTINAFSYKNATSLIVGAMNYRNEIGIFIKKFKKI